MKGAARYGGDPKCRNRASQAAGQTSGPFCLAAETVSEESHPAPLTHPPRLVRRIDHESKRIGRPRRDCRVVFRRHQVQQPKGEERYRPLRHSAQRHQRRRPAWLSEMRRPRKISPRRLLERTLDVGRFEEIDRLADRAASYWLSVALAPNCGRLTAPDASRAEAPFRFPKGFRDDATVF
jgi:hypothetical protein